MGEIVDRRIYEIEASPSTYKPKQTGFDGSADSDLGYRMFCGKDSDENIIKMLAKSKPAIVQTLNIVNDDFQFLFFDAGNAGTLRATNTVSGEGQLRFRDDLLDGGSIVARFADTVEEAEDFVDDFGDSSIMGAMSWLKGNPVSGLNEDQLVFGKADGTVDQSASLTFNADNELIIGSGDEKLILAWDRIVGGDTVSLAGTVGSVIAVSDNPNGLSLTGSMGTSLVLGPGTIDADRSLIAGAPPVTIGQGTGHTLARGDSLLCMGGDLTIDARWGAFVGTHIDADSCDCSSAWGHYINVLHSYATARGKYVNTIWEGARHFGCDRYDTDDGSAMGIDGMVLVGTQSGGGTCILHTTFGDASSYSFSIPDNRAMTVRWILQTSSVGADNINGGLYSKTGYSTIWHNAGYQQAFESEQEAILDRGGYVGEDWETSLNIYHHVGDPTGTFRVEVMVTGTCTTDLVHILIIESAVITPTSIIASS